MSTPAIEDIQQDQLAMAVAAALAVANDAAEAQGVDLSQSRLTVTEEAPPPDRLWRIHYGPRDYIHRRGGDLIVLVEERNAAVQRIMRGQ